MKKIIVVVFGILIVFLSMINQEPVEQKNMEGYSVRYNNGSNLAIKIGVKDTFFEEFKNFFEFEGDLFDGKIGTIILIPINYNNNMELSRNISDIDFMMKLTEREVEFLFVQNKLRRIEKFLKKDKIYPLYFEYSKYTEGIYSFSPTISNIPLVFYNNNYIKHDKDRTYFEDILKNNNIKRKFSLGGPIDSTEDILNLFYHIFYDHMCFNMRFRELETYDDYVERYVDNFCSILSNSRYTSREIGNQYPMDWIFSDGMFSLKVGNTYELSLFTIDGLADNKLAGIKAPFNPMISDFQFDVSLGIFDNQDYPSFTTAEIVTLDSTKLSDEAIGAFYHYFQSDLFYNNLLSNDLYSPFAANIISYPTVVKREYVNKINDIYNLPFGDILYNSEQEIRENMNAFVNIDEYFSKIDLNKLIMDKCK